LKNSGIPDDVDEDDAVTVILEFFAPIMEDFVGASKDMNATHVLRAGLCMLAGLPVISERRGKASKHQHSVALSEPLDALLRQPEGFHLDSSLCFAVPDSFQELLGSTVAGGLLSLPASELQNLVVDLSGAAVISFVLRVLFSPGVIEGGPDLADRLVRRVLEWRDDKSDDSGPAVLYAMCGEKSGSYFLETVMQCCGIELFLELTERAVRGKAAEYGEDATANFVLQTILRRLLAEAEHRALACSEDSSAGDLAANGRVLALVSGLVGELTTPATFSMLLNRRGGVLFWVIKLADIMCKFKDSVLLKSDKKKKKSKKEDGQSTADEADVSAAAAAAPEFASTVASMLLKEWGVASDAAADAAATSGLAFHVDEISRRLGGRVGEEEKEKVVEEPKKGRPAPAAVPSNKPAVTDSTRDPLQLMTAKLAGAVLEMTAADTLEARQLLSRAIASMESRILFSIATSGPMSKAILDVVFSGSSDGDLYSTAREKAMNTLMPKAIDLSCHFVGQHIVRAYYNSTTRPATREKLILALVGPDVAPDAKERLRRSNQGQHILIMTQADLFVRNKEEWKSSMRKYEKGKSLLQDLEGMGAGRSAAAASSASSRGTPFLPSGPFATRPAAAAAPAAFAISKPGAALSKPADAPVLAPTADSNIPGADKRKRKRKRGGNKNKGDDDNEDGDEEGAEATPAAAPAATITTTAAAPESDIGESVPRAGKEEKKEKKQKAARRDDGSDNEASASAAAEDRSDKPSKSSRSDDKKEKHSSKKHSSAPAAQGASAGGDRPRKRSKGPADSTANMDLVRTLNSGKLMSKSMLADTITRLEDEQRGKA
jgi:hypothetical protein